MKFLENKSPIVPSDCKGGSLQEKSTHTRAQRLGRHTGRRENIKRSSFIEIWGLHRRKWICHIDCKSALEALKILIGNPSGLRCRQREKWLTITLLTIPRPICPWGLDSHQHCSQAAPPFYVFIGIFQFPMGLETLIPFKDQRYRSISNRLQQP